MANQIIVESGTGNITVTTSRSVIGTLPNVANANYSNFAGQVIDSAQPNITSTGTLTSLDIAGDLTVGGNLSVGNLIANNANYANFAGEAYSVDLANVSGAGNIASINLDGNVSNVLRGDGTFSADVNYGPAGSNTQVQYNDNGSFGAEANFTYNSATNTLTSDNINANAFVGGTFTGDGSDLTSVRAETIEITIKNAEPTANIAKGMPVHAIGTAVGGEVEVVLADAGNASLMPAHFIANELLTPGDSGRGILSGRIFNVDTSSFAVGDVIYVAVGGGYANTAPSGEANLIQNLGVVTDVDVNGQGEVYGAGRSAATPNLNDGNIFIGDASNQSTTTNFLGAINTHLAAFGSNTITTTGLITGDGGGLSNIAGGNVTGSVANAVYADQAGFAGSSPPAGSNTQVQFNDADVLGADANFTYNKSTPALSVGFSGDGQLLSSQVALNKTLTSNTYLLSTTATLNNASDMTLWKANVTDTLSGANTKLIDMVVDSNSMMSLNKTGDFTVAGNLFVGNATANVAIASQGDITFNSSNSVQTLEQYTADYSGGPGAYKFNNEKVYVVNGYGTTPFVDAEATLGSIKYFADDGANLAQGFQQEVYALDPLSSDPLVPATFVQSVPSYLTDLANADTQTTTELSINADYPGCFFAVNTEIPADPYGNAGPVWRQKQYSDTAIRFERRNGNADARTQVVAGDQIGRIEWAPESLTGGGGGPQLRSRPGFITGKVSSAFTGAWGERVGQGIEFGVVNDGGLNVVTHDFYPNGDVRFSGTITAASYVTLGNETIANLTSNTPVVVGEAGAMISVSDADYQPAHWSVADNVWKYVSNRANV